MDFAGLQNKMKTLKYLIINILSGLFRENIYIYILIMIKLLSWSWI